MRLVLVWRRPGGVGEHQVGALRGGRLDGVEDDGAGVAALGAAHEVGTGTTRPGLELLGGRGPERVARGHHHLVAVAHQALAELADGGGLAHAVDAHEQPHVGATVVEAQGRSVTWRRSFISALSTSTSWSPVSSPCSFTRARS
jgi:hypothetical protein